MLWRRVAQVLTTKELDPRDFERCAIDLTRILHSSTHNCLLERSHGDLVCAA